MSKRMAFWLAWSVWLLCLGMMIATLFSQIRQEPAGWFGELFDTLVLLAFATVGALIASHRPEHPIGWLFCASTLLWTLGVVLVEYTVSDFLANPAVSPLEALAGAIGLWARAMGWYVMLTYLLLLFPNGHLPSPRWRFLARFIAGSLFVYSLALLLSPYPYANVNDHLAAVRNPLGLLVAGDLVDQLANLGILLMFPIILSCIVAVVLRFRRARGIERQQLKWFAYGTALSILILLIIFIVVFFTPSGGPDWPFYLSVVAIPISAGIALLRYRLYDIDTLINRTLVYGLLTTMLLGVYLLLVFGGQYLLASFLGPNNTVPLVVSTLVVAALFNPLRRRFQRLVDRSFYRSKYDAALVVERFGETLRQEMNLDQICEQVALVIQETVQPTHFSLWLRPPENPAIVRQKETSAHPSAHC